MDTAQIHDQLVVNINPNIVISREGEILPSLISEGRMPFEGEVVIMWISFISKPLTVNRKEARIQIFKNPRAWRRFVECQRHRDIDIGPSHIVKPLSERGCARYGCPWNSGER